jgi:hypothetical protein
MSPRPPPHPHPTAAAGPPSNTAGAALPHVGLACYLPHQRPLRTSLFPLACRPSAGRRTHPSRRRTQSPPSSHLVIVVGSELPSAGSVAPITQEAPRGHPRCPPCRDASGRRRVTGGRVQQCRRRRSPHFSVCSVGTWTSARRWSPRHRHHARPHQRGCRRVIARICPGGPPLTW